MKKSFEILLSEVNRKKMQRHRMIALLLVLSLFVTSGVSWALHGVGLTMANEAECGIEEHVHTDACWEKQLVCGLEDDTEHVHTDDCWEEQLVCGLTEHVHDASCYTGSTDFAALLGGSSVTLDEAITNAEGIADYDAYTDDYVVEADDEPEEMLRAPALRAAENGSTGSFNDQGQYILDTIDNIAEGIKFTLFDYGGSELESQNNNYGFARDNGGALIGPPYQHNFVSDTGINTGRNARDDILFLAYGTPVPAGAGGAGVEGGSNVYNYWDGDTHIYVPDKNSYSGDYNSNPAYPGNRPVQGIVQSELGSDGYPHIAGSGNSLAYLFAPTTNLSTTDGNVDQSAYKTVYTNVNHLLQKDNKTGHLYYNSNDNYAYYDQTTGNFIVYGDDPAIWENPDDPENANRFRGTFDIINDAHHLGGQFTGRYDNEENKIYYDENDTVDPYFKIGFFPFDPYDDTRRNPNFDGNGYNHHFGMTMEAEFINPNSANITEPVTFKYSGDDDMWVFVDGKLVLDIGGIHEPAGGMIDFTNGIVWTQDNGTGMPLTSDDPEKDSVQKTLTNWGIISSEEDWTKLPTPIGIDTASTSSGSEENKWIVTKISDYISDWDSTAHTKTHKINMFYLERGGCYSNLAMEMNLPTVKPLTVMKNVEYQHHYIKGLYEDLKYTFRIWEWDDDNKVWAQTQGNDPDGDFYLKELDPEGDGSFILKDGERKTFEDLGQTRIFKVVEEGVNPNIIGSVTVNGSPVTVTNGEATLGGQALSDVNSYNFNNEIIEEVGPIVIRKAWEPADVAIPPGYDSVKFKIMRTDDQTGEVKQVALKQGDIKVRTFSVSAAEWAEGKTVDGLLKRYGNHTYSYEVEELNVPRDFKATYSTDDNGNIVITNTDIHKVNLNAKKQWENTENPPKVQLRLTRKKAEYEGSKPTRLTVNIVDEAGNPIISYTTPQETPGTPYSGPYAGGGLEVSYAIPAGAEYYTADPDYPQVSPETIDLQVHPDENILVINNLAENGNTVTIKVKTADAKDAKLLQHHSFSDSDQNAALNVLTQKWTVQHGGPQPVAAASYDSEHSYGKDGGSLMISNRERSNDAATIYLDPSIYFANKTYTFSAYVYSPVGDTFKMTFFDGLGEHLLDDGTLSGNGYQPIGQEVYVPAGEWRQITGTIRLGASDSQEAEIDPYNMRILIESIPANGDYTDFPLSSEDATWFLVDEFTAIEGTDPVTVSDNGGAVTIGGNRDDVLYDFQFQNGDSSEGWNVMDFSGDRNTRIQPGGNYWFHGILVTGRDAHNDGINISVPNLEPGKTYHFEGRAQEHNGSSAQTIQLSMDTGNNSWPTVVGDIHLNTDSDNQWEEHPFAGDFMIPANANRDTMTIYFETPDENPPDTGDFRLLYLTITEPGTAGNPPDVPGYSESTGQYVTDFYDRIYQIVPDPNSYTNPLHLKGDGTYEIDTEPNGTVWAKTITLPDDSDDGKSWTYHWGSDYPVTDRRYIKEENDCLYEYHLEEIMVYDSAGNELTKNDDGNWVDANGKVMYLVSYMNNDVDTNTPQNPITVKNTYIWYWLPDTGGMGANGYCFTGLLLAMTGMIGGYALKRRERRFR